MNRRIIKILKDKDTNLKTEDKNYWSVTNHVTNHVLIMYKTPQIKCLFLIRYIGSEDYGLT